MTNRENFERFAALYWSQDLGVYDIELNDGRTHFIESHTIGQIVNLKLRTID